MTWVNKLWPFSGPMQTISLGGSRYFLTFLNHHSRQIVVNFMKQKNKPLEKFILYRI